MLLVAPGIAISSKKHKRCKTEKHNGNFPERLRGRSQDLDGLTRGTALIIDRKLTPGILVAISSNLNLVICDSTLSSFLYQNTEELKNGVYQQHLKIEACDGTL